MNSLSPITALTTSALEPLASESGFELSRVKERRADDHQATGAGSGLAERFRRLHRGANL